MALFITTPPSGGVLTISLSTCLQSAALWIAGCPELPPVQLCGEIPAGGCPIGRGGTCDDVTCNGLYDCVDGAWTLAKACPGDGGPGDGGPIDGGDGGPDGDGGCTPSM